jgi:multisubunit Na+/H+ antiporter MnhG subunit
VTAADGARIALGLALAGPGAVILIVAAFGLLRLGDASQRLHALRLGETLGAGLCLAGLAVAAGDAGAGLKLVLLAVIVWTGATTIALAIGPLGRRDSDLEP